ncbi:MAG: SufD family Fe-S cluster assembly protein [Pseudomonadota bacterium]
MSRAEELLSRHPTPAGGSWFGRAIADAELRFTGMGAPKKRDEYWKYTDPAPLLDAPAHPGSDQLSAAALSLEDPIRLVFVDGRFDADASDPLEGPGLVIDLLSDAAKTDIHWAKDMYGVLETAGQDPVHRPLAALNTARASEGLCIHVIGKATRPIYIQYLCTENTDDVFLHHVVKVDSDAEATLIEETAGSGRSNTQIELQVAEQGAVHHIRIQAPEHEVVRHSHLFARLAKECAVKSLTISVNGRFTRNEAVVTFTGDRASAHIAGATAGDGTGFHHDDTVFVTHDAVDCESRQVFKKMLKNGATGVFQGKILVQPNAQKTDGYQISQGLLLDDDSQFLAKPELEIYADDVACSHGSTVGAIDEEAVFYLTSRGVPRHQAVEMLVLAFLGEAIEEVEDSGLADHLMSRLTGWMKALGPA